MLPMFPAYRAGKTDYPTIQRAAIALGKVTLNEDYDPPPKPAVQVMDVYAEQAKALEAGMYARPTMFREIVAVPELIPPGLRELHPKPAGEIVVPLEELARQGLAALRAYIARTWVGDTEYLMPHSSGYDSRLISALVAEQKTGNLYFLLWQPETEQARKLLLSMGWDASRIIEIGEGITDYQAPALDFLSLGAYQTEAERFAPGPSLVDLHLGASREDWTTITATFADETMGFNVNRWPSVSYFHAARLLDTPRPWASERWLMPFVSREWLEFATTYRFPGQPDELKRAMLRQIDPALAEFPNQRYDLGRQIAKHGHHDYARLSEATRERMDADYWGSWYCNHTERGITIPNAFGSHDPAVRDYIKAAICEFLIMEGVEIV